METPISRLLLLHRSPNLPCVINEDWKIGLRWAHKPHHQCLTESPIHSLLLSSFHCAGSPPPSVLCDCSCPPSKVVTLSIFLPSPPSALLLLLSSFLPSRSAIPFCVCLRPACQYATSILAAVNRHGRRKRGVPGGLFQPREEFSIKRKSVFLQCS